MSFPSELKKKSRLLRVLNDAEQPGSEVHQARLSKLGNWLVNANSTDARANSHARCRIVVARGAVAAVVIPWISVAVAVVRAIARSVVVSVGVRPVLTAVATAVIASAVALGFSGVGRRQAADE